MPKLLVQRKKNERRPTPPCGRVIHYVEPHSPFQKLVDAKRMEKGMSVRELAREMSRKAKISQSTVWIWLHHKNGYPHPKSFTKARSEALCSVLGLKSAELHRVIDASRHLFTPREIPMPQESVDALRTLIEILDRDGRTRIPRGYIRNLARNLYNGATGDRLK
jgi:hypothetical protein